VAKLHVTDEANLFRAEIEGRFSGEIVERVRGYWQSVMAEGCVRRFTVDISQLTGYDAAGRRLLRDMYKHGVYLSARTPRSLVFLDEIAEPAIAGPTLVYKAPEPEPETAPAPKPAATVAPLTRAAVAGK
jgi:hypothetical protein